MFSIHFRPTVPTSRVRAGSDAGDYYCEHVYYVAQRAMQGEGARVPRAGFLHFPPDPPEAGTPERTQYNQVAMRVLSQALRGYVEPLRQHEAQVRVLWTGFPAFSYIGDNPTGALLRQNGRPFELVSLAFPRATIRQRSEGCFLIDEPGRPVLELVLQTRVLPVDDRAIVSSSPESVGSLIHSFRPHVTLLTGVGRQRTFIAERNADDGGMLNGKHEDGERRTHRLPPNATLLEAIHRGRRLLR